VVYSTIVQSLSQLCITIIIISLGHPSKDWWTSYPRCRTGGAHVCGHNTLNDRIGSRCNYNGGI